MKHNIKIICLVVSLLMLAPLAITACAAPAEQQPLKIGGMFDLTGPAVPPGVAGYQGAVLAMEEAGYQLDGQPIEFIIEDAATDPSIAMDKARKLVESDKVIAIVGPLWDPSAVALASYFDKVKIPHIDYGPQAPNYVLGHSWTWQPVVPGSGLGYVAGKYAGSVLGYKKVTTLAAEFEVARQFTEGFAMGLEEEGGKVIQTQYFPPPTTDFSPFFTTLSKEADAFMVWAPAIWGPPVYGQLREFGVKLPIICPEPGGTLEDPDGMTQEMGPNIVGVKTTVVWGWTLDNPKSKKFVEAYRAKWGMTPDHMAAVSYSNVNILLEAIKKAGDDVSPETINKALGETSMDTVRGHISFTPDRYGIHDIHIAEVVKVGDTYEPKVLKSFIITPDVVNGELKYSLK